jgi:hypothetical protein
MMIAMSGQAALDQVPVVIASAPDGLVRCCAAIGRPLLSFH